MFYVMPETSEYKPWAYIIWEGFWRWPNARGWAYTRKGLYIENNSNMLKLK